MLVLTFHIIILFLLLLLIQLKKIFGEFFPTLKWAVQRAPPHMAVQRGARWTAMV